MSTKCFEIATYNILDAETALHSANYDHGKVNPGVRFNAEKKLFESNWDDRKSYVAANILDSKAGIVCLQEVTSEALRNIISLLAEDYRVAIHASHKSSFVSNGKLGENHGVAILYKPSEFQLLTRSVIGDSRKVAIAKFQHKTFRKVFEVATLHLLRTLRNPSVQIKNIIGILEKVSHFKDCILCGDFNSSLEQNSSIVQILRKNSFEHCGNPPKLGKLQVIDGIFCKFTRNVVEPITLITQLGTQRGREQDPLLLASDHSLLWTRIDYEISQNPKSQRAVVSRQPVSTDSWDLEVALPAGGDGGGNSSCSGDFKQLFGDGQDTSWTSQKKSSRSSSSDSFEDSSRSDSPESQGGPSDSSSSVSLENSSCSDSGTLQGGLSHPSSVGSSVNSSHSDSPDSGGRSSRSSSLSSYSEDGSNHSSDWLSVVDDSSDFSDSSDYVSVVDSGSDSSDSEDNDVLPFQNSTEQNEVERERTWEDFVDEDLPVSPISP